MYLEDIAKTQPLPPEGYKFSKIKYEVPVKGDYILLSNGEWGETKHNDYSGKMVMFTKTKIGSVKTELITRIEDLKLGDLVALRNRDGAYTVTALYGSRVTAVKTVDVTNPCEWIKITP